MDKSPRAFVTHQKWIFCTTLVVVCLILFMPLLKAHFIQLDDPKHTFENPLFNPVNLKNTVQIWKAPYFSLYIPATYSVWGMGALASTWLFGNGQLSFRADVFHGLNIILHIANVLLLFSILSTLLTPGKTHSQKQTDGFSPPHLAAFFGALLFALHPLQVETIAWISAMKDCLATFFSFLAIRSYLIYSQQGIRKDAKRTHYLMATGAFILALLSKPSAVVVPLVLILLNRYFRDRSWKDASLGLLLWIGLCLPIVVITKGLQPDTQITELSPLFLRPFIALDAIAFYLYKIPLPFGLAIDHGRSPQWILHKGWIYISWLAPVALGTFLFIQRKRRAKLWGAFIIFVIALLPIVGLVPFLFQKFSTVADHYLYFPLFALALLVGTALNRPLSKPHLGIVGIVFLALALKTTFQVPVWKDGISVFTHTAKRTPHSLLAHNNLGVEYQLRQKYRKAAEHFLIVQKLQPEDAGLLSNLGAALVSSGQVKKGLTYLLRAVKLDSKMAPMVYYNLGKTYLRLGEFDKALYYAKKTIQQNPTSPRAHQLWRAAQMARGS